MRVWCKESVAYATEILQIFEKIKQIGNKLPLKTYSAMPARRLHTDYTDSFSIDNW